MPSSSPAAAATLEPTSFFAYSPSSLAERSATSCRTRAVWSEFIGGILLSIAALLLGRRKARHAVGTDAASEPPIVVQVMQMRDRLAHGEEYLAGVQLAPEQHFQHVRRMAR